MSSLRTCALALILRGGEGGKEEGRRKPRPGTGQHHIGNPKAPRHQDAGIPVRLGAVSVVTPIEYGYEYVYVYGYEFSKLDPSEGTVKANTSAAFREPANILLPFCVQFRP